MLTPIPDLPQAIAGLTASHTVLAADIDSALADLPPAEQPPGARLLVEVVPDFDGYMAELVSALLRAGGDGRLARAALVLPDRMLPEAELAGAPAAGGKLRAFGQSDAAAARRWLAG